MREEWRIILIFIATLIGVFFRTHIFFGFFHIHMEKWMVLDAITFKTFNVLAAVLTFAGIFGLKASMTSEMLIHNGESNYRI